MSTQTKFFFTGQDNTKKAFDSINKSMKQAAKQAVVLTTAMNVLGAAVKGAAKAITTVLGAAFKGIVSLVKGALNTIKALITGTFKFIKTALTTLLSWIKKALGKVFDWMTSTIKNIFNGIVKLSQSAINAAKRALDVIIQSVKDYAAKEYNEIQLKVSLGNSFSAVMKDFKELLRYTTADKNDLLSVYSTFAELGKKPEEVVKYARATVYLANATGKSLAQIQRLLLGQEAAGKDLETVLHRIGVDISEQETSLTNVERIISQLDDEMQELANSSLSQMFANVKNDLITIREQLGTLFSGPVRYVAQKIDDLLRRIIGSNKIENLSSSINKLFDKIKPTIDKVFTFFEKFIQDPGGFFKALWQDIQQIFSNIWNRLDEYVSIIGYIFGQALTTITDAIHSIDWGSVSEAFDNLATVLQSFVINVAVGLDWFDEEDVVEGNLAATFRNAWNKAHPDFQLSENDKWYQTLFKLTNGILEDLDSAFVKWWNGLDWDISNKIQLDENQEWYKNLFTLLTGLLSSLWDNVKTFWNDTLKPKLSEFWDNFKTNWKDKILPALKTSFEWLGEVLGATFTNLVLKSEVLKKIMSALGHPMVSGSDRDKIYGLLNGKGLLPQGMTLDDFRGLDLNSKAPYPGFSSWAEMIDIWGKSSLFTEEEGNLIRRLGRAGEVLEETVVPSLDDLADRINNALNPQLDGLIPQVEDLSDSMGPLVDALKSFREIDSKRVWHYTGSGFITGGSGFSGSGGGIHNLYSDEFRFKPYAKGGLVTKPTLALIGEAGPEFIVPLKNLPKLADGNDSANGVSAFDWNNPFASAKAILGISKDLSVITKDTSFIFKWYEETPTLDEVVEDGVKTEISLVVPWYKKIWNATKAIGKGFASYIGGTAKVLAMNGAFGSHIGNIAAGIQAQQENGTLTIWTALGEIIKEFLPYLQKGLAIVGGIFDEAFDILGNAVQILGEEIGNTLLPLLEAFIPFFKVIADIVVSLAPVVSSVIAPAIKIIAAILNVLTGVLDKLMPVFAALASVIQWVSDAISYAIGSVINWLASWIPWIHSTSVSRPKSIGEYYDNIMGTYDASKTNSISVGTSSASVASQTASYSGSNHIYITNDFSGSYVVGSGGFRELALIIKNTMEDLDYSGQSV